MVYANKESVFFYFVLVIAILHEVTSKSTVNRENSNLQNSSYTDQREHRNLNEDIEEDDVPDYPYEEIRELVKETKEFLKSSSITEEEKKKLDLDPSFYKIYLQGDYSDPLPTQPPHVISSSDPLSTTTSNDTTAPPYSGFGAFPIGTPSNASYAGMFPSGTGVSSSSGNIGSVTMGLFGGVPHFTPTCQAQHRFRIPKKMKAIDGKDYYIVNVGKDFTQRVRIVVCQNPNQGCGKTGDWPENYNYHCEQNFGMTRDLLAIPVGKSLDMWQQSKRRFKIPNECKCQLSRQNTL